ncbi:unnamed protein product [Cladocopium goreaui]|uniref:Uncharacterized protein n=1 Tax=Cladocopium goreaui TaxID=2562237 RepID=A0A9P1CCE0_9DINO|nr:unnamed protein product [Cladocopium goreaui]
MVKFVSNLIDCQCFPRRIQKPIWHVLCCWRVQVFCQAENAAEKKSVLKGETQSTKWPLSTCERKWPWGMAEMILRLHGALVGPSGSQGSQGSGAPKWCKQTCLAMGFVQDVSSHWHVLSQKKWIVRTSLARHVPNNESFDQQKIGFKPCNIGICSRKTSALSDQD